MATSPPTANAFTGVAIVVLLILVAGWAMDLVDARLGAAIAAVLIAGVVWCRRQARRPAPALSATVAPAVPTIPQEFLDRIPDPLVVLDGTRRIAAINTAARDLFGGGTLGRDLALSIRHPKVLTAVDALQGGAPTITEDITLPVPVPRAFTMHGAGLQDTGMPSAPRFLFILHDETRSKRAEQSQADFIANASHELRSPLSTLLGFIETLQGPACDDEEARQRFLGIMLTEARRMARLVDDLLSLSRVEINEHVPPREAVTLDDLFEDVADALALRAEAKQMRIEVTCPEALPPVIGDRDQLVQVVYNLVDNAVKYGRAGTAIRVRAEAMDRLPWTAGPGVGIFVSDEGPGIAAIHLPRLTERFYRIDQGRSRRLGGTGLGLAIAKHIVKRHRGRLEIESTEGVGSTFRVVLPAFVDREAAGARAAQAHAGEPGVGPPSGASVI